MAFIAMNAENNASSVPKGFGLEESLSFVEAISCFRNACLEPISGMYSSNDPSPSLKPEGGYNPLCSPATTKRWLKPPVLAPSNYSEVEVE
jgi:hypothetical protein